MDERELNMDAVTPQDSQDTDEQERKPRSRYVPQEVVSKLLEDARDRCCLCRLLIQPQQLDDDTLFGSLEKHHIVHFSEGGGNTYDNLLLVCANCHSQIHTPPEKYTADELRGKKLHWIGMKEVVPAHLHMTVGSLDTVQVTFAVESVNLHYSIVASPETKVSELALFVRDRILSPLGEYDNNSTWVNAKELTLALRPAPAEALDSDLSLRELQLAPDDVLVANISARVVPILVPAQPISPGAKRLGDGEGVLERDGVPKARGGLERRYWFEPEMAHIPAGRFWMGTDRLALARSGIEWEEWFEEETPCCRAYLPAYWIGKYLVTNSQFTFFVEDGGYQNRDYWTKNAWRCKEEWSWTQPRYWEDERFNDPFQPVVGVSWYEAVAYCNWMAAITGKPYRLPSESEWEKAARGTDGRLWPWGDRWDPERCNSRENGPHRTTPVGRYSPIGDSPYGLADMAGNAWEWTRSLYRDYPYAGVEREDSEATGSHVVRGGSFYDDLLLVRCAYRYRFGPDSLWFQSFRLVMAPIPC